MTLRILDITVRELPVNKVTTTSTTMYIASLYSLASEYTLLDDALSYPKYYEVKRWMTANDVLEFEFFKQYYIRELNGSFFINKIKGFNPDKSKQATTLELFKISDDVPLGDIVVVEYWEDGLGTIWNDGVGNKFTTN